MRKGTSLYCLGAKQTKELPLKFGYFLVEKHGYYTHPDHPNHRHYIKYDKDGEVYFELKIKRNVPNPFKNLNIKLFKIIKHPRKWSVKYNSWIECYECLGFKLYKLVLFSSKNKYKFSL